MEEVGSSPSSDVCDPPADKELEIGKHCIRLTKEQYTTLRELRDDPLFKKAILTRLSYPSWEKLMTGKTSSKGFTWIVYHYWLGSLKFALQSRCVEGGEKLYTEIFAVYNELLSVSKPDDAYHVFCPPRKRKLVFEHVHVGEGVFRLRLEGYNPAEEQPQPKTTSHTEEACQRRVRVLSAEAMHVTRGSPWPKMCRSLHFHVAGLPYSVLDVDGVEFSHRSLDQASFGTGSAPFRHELRRSVAYIAEQMEERGDPVDWESLYVQAIATDVCTHPNLLSSLSERVNDFIKSRGRELLQNSRQ